MFVFRLYILNASVALDSSSTHLPFLNFQNDLRKWAAKTAMRTYELDLMGHKHYELYIAANYVPPPASQWPSKLAPYKKRRLYGGNDERHREELLNC
jgi:hypothetical protein